MMNLTELFIFLLLCIMVVAIAWSFYYVRGVFHRARFNVKFSLADEKAKIFKIALGLLLFGLCLGFITSFASMSGGSETINILMDIDNIKLGLLQTLFCAISWFIFSGLVIIYRIHLNLYLNKLDHKKLQENDNTKFS